MADRPEALSCAHPEHRQFDFWLGDLDVTNAAGEQVGRSRITLVAGGCGVREEWHGKGGLIGTSLNTWTAERGWHQTWIDSNGGLLLLEGGLRGGTMVLEGLAPDDENPGRELLQRISWSIVDGDPNGVRQLWQTSADGGQTWEMAFEGHYVRTR